MLSIAFGLLLYNILKFTMTIIFIVIIVACLENVFNGLGLWHNLRAFWCGVVQAAKYLTGKRNDIR